MDLYKILEHNKDIQEKVKALHQEIDLLDNSTIAPCDYCPYDGVFRCEACQANYFEGFNIKEYPY